MATKQELTNQKADSESANEPKYTENKDYIPLITLDMGGTYWCKRILFKSCDMARRSPKRRVNWALQKIDCILTSTDKKTWKLYQARRDEKTGVLTFIPHAFRYVTLCHFSENTCVLNYDSDGDIEFSHVY